MDAVIIAGGKINSNDRLWGENIGSSKALIDIYGKPMVQWIIDAANGANSVDKIYLVGLVSVKSIKSEKTLIQLPDFGGIVENLSAAAELIIKNDPKTEYFLSITADIPFINSSIIDSIASKSYESGYDIFYHVIEKDVMEARFPGAKRTYMRLRNGRFCGGDMHIISTHAFTGPIVHDFVKYRKNPIKLVLLIGFRNLIRKIFFPPLLENVEKIVRDRTKINAKPVISNFAELGMDVDNPEHLSIAREELCKRINNEK